jgi:hypothetical protein
VRNFTYLLLDIDIDIDIDINIDIDIDELPNKLKKSRKIKK